MSLDETIFRTWKLYERYTLVKYHFLHARYILEKQNQAIQSAWGHRRGESARGGLAVKNGRVIILKPA